MSIEHDIKKTAAIIKKYLPKWNHSTAVCDHEKESFIRAVNQLDFQKEKNALWQDFATLIAEHVPDNHINLKRNGKNLVPKKVPAKKTDVSKTIFPSAKAIPISDEKGNWYIDTKKIGNKSVGIITIPFFSYSDNEPDLARENFIRQFFQLKKENKWNNIIFDFRGNTGGDAAVMKEIAERMAGYTVKYADRTEAVIPNETDPYRHLFLKKHQESEIPSIITDDKTDRFSGPIYILQDGWNASATEGAIYMLKQLPNAKTIGEKTSGTYQNGATILLPVTEDTELIIGTKYLERWDKTGAIIEEKEGMKPDIATKAEKALSKALLSIKLRSPVLTQSLFVFSQLADSFLNHSKKHFSLKKNNQR